MPNQKITVLILLILNALFFIVIWHMDVNFMAKKFGEKQTNGLFRIKTQNAHRYSEYLAMATFLLMDILFVWQFL